MVEWDSALLRDPFVARVVALASEEAGELECSVVDAEHLLLAATRPELEGPSLLGAVGLDARKVRDFAIFLSGVNEVLTANIHKRPYRRTAKYRSEPLILPTGPTIEAARVVADVATEAKRSGKIPGPPHLLAALRGFFVGFGVKGNDLRRALGLPAFHASPDVPRLPRPQGIGPLVLGGGADDIALRVIDRLRLSDPTVVYLGAGDADHPGPGWMGESWARAGCTVVDAALYHADDAWRDESIAALRGADVVLLGCGQLGALAHTLVGTPALTELIAASDRGAVVVGSSSTSMELGSAAVDPYADDGPTLVPVLGWLDGVVVSTHHRGTVDELDNLRRWIWPLSNNPVLLLPHQGAVLVHPGWSTFELLDAGEHDRGAWWWTEPEREPRQLAEPDSSA